MKILTNKYRRINASSKSWCRSPVMSRASDNISYLSLRKRYPSSFSTNSERNNLTKIHFRNFRNRYMTQNFLSKLTKKYHSRFKKPLHIRVNIRGTKIEYYTGKKI